MLRYVAFIALVISSLSYGQSPHEIRSGYGYQVALINSVLYGAGWVGENTSFGRTTSGRPEDVYGGTKTRINYDSLQKINYPCFVVSSGVVCQYPAEVGRGQVSHDRFYRAISRSYIKEAIYDDAYYTRQRARNPQYFIDDEGLKFEWGEVKLKGASSAASAQDTVCAIAKGVVHCWTGRYENEWNRVVETKLDLSVVKDLHLISEWDLCVLLGREIKCLDTTNKIPNQSVYSGRVKTPEDLSDAHQVLWVGNRVFYLTGEGLKFFDIGVNSGYRYGRDDEPRSLYTTEVKKFEGADAELKDTLYFSSVEGGLSGRQYYSGGIEKTGVCALTITDLNCVKFVGTEKDDPYNSRERIYPSDYVKDRVIFHKWLITVLAPNLYREKKLFLQSVSEILQSASGVEDYIYMTMMMESFVSHITSKAISAYNKKAMTGFVAMFRDRMRLAKSDKFVHNQDSVKAYYRMIRAALKAATPLLQVGGRQDVDQVLKRLGQIAADEDWSPTVLKGFHESLAGHKGLMKDLKAIRAAPFYAFLTQKLP